MKSLLLLFEGPLAGLGFWGSGFGVWHLGFRVVGFRVLGFGLRSPKGRGHIRMTLIRIYEVWGNCNPIETDTGTYHWEPSPPTVK